MNEPSKHPGSQSSASTSKPTRYFWIGNTVRGLLLTIDVVAGGVLAMLSFGAVSMSMDDGGLFALEWPTVVLALVLGTLGIWLMVAGVLLVWTKRLTCWNNGAWNHSLAALGFFLLIPVMWFHFQYEMQVRPGHTAMEGARGTAFLCIGIGILGVLWFVTAGVLKAIEDSERRHVDTESPNLPGRKEPK